MVRDGAHFYDPLGLVAEGVKVDFQVGVNAYLYGTRFMSYMAYTTSPDKLVEWVARTDGSRHITPASSGRSSGSPGFSLGRVDRVGARVPARQPRVRAAFPDDRYRDLSPRALGSVSRAFVDDQAGRLYAGVRYPGIVAHIAAISLATDPSGSSGHQGPGAVPRYVAGLGPEREDAVLHHRQQRLSGHRGARRGQRESRMLLEDARIGELVLNPRIARCGVSGT
jgi:hypothetical protein